MPICVNQSGTWRNIVTQCVNQSGTWRRVLDGCVNQSGTWRCYGMRPPTVSISVSPTSIFRTCSHTVTWSTTQATSLTSNFGVTALSGTVTRTPTATTTYTATATNNFGSVSNSATVTVTLPNPGTNFQGGRLICRAGGVFWIVAPSSAQVSRTWYLRNNANTRAQQVSGCTGWFVPTRPQLQNPGYTCRTFWDSFSSTYYWSSTEASSGDACGVNFNNGLAACFFSKTNTFCVRAFRCVTY
jgi:hypothetical protein